MKILKAKMEISSNDWKRLNALDNLINFDDESEEMEKLIEYYGAKQYDTSYAFCFEFEDGHTIEIRQYSGSSNYWLDGWKDDESNSDEVIDLNQQIEYIDFDNDTTYVCEFVIE